MKTTMIAFAASTAVATAAVKDASGWVGEATPKQNTKCYTEATAPAKEKWTRTSECRKLCGVYPQGSGTVPGTIDGEKCGEQTKPVASGEYAARVKCVGSWKQVTPKFGDEDKTTGKRPKCSAEGTAAKTVTNEFKCLNQDGDAFALDADKCGVPTFFTYSGTTPITKADLDKAIDPAEATAKTACDAANAFSAGSCMATIKTYTYAALPKCVPTTWSQTNGCSKSCGQAATTDEAKTYKCLDQFGGEIAVDSKGECGSAKPTDKQSCTATDACDTYPACPLASGAEKVAMTAAVAIAAIAMF